MSPAKPRYVAVPCSWCRADHWLVKRNIETSRALPAVAAFTDKAAAEQEAARLSATRRRP